LRSAGSRRRGASVFVFAGGIGALQRSCEGHAKDIARSRPGPSWLASGRLSPSGGSVASRPRRRPPDATMGRDGATGAAGQGLASGRGRHHAGSYEQPNARPVLLDLGTAGRPDQIPARAARHGRRRWIAYPGNYRADPRGSVALFRLVVGGHELPGRWVCLRRQFVPAAEGGAGS
jgi:hypothetical protein